MYQSLIVYDYSPWGRSLASALFPGARRFPARLPDNADRILEAVNADDTAFLFHIDLTDSRSAPTDRVSLGAGLRRRGIAVLNEAVTDISKRKLQAVCRESGLPHVTVDRNGPADERLIVKTDRNYGGLPEHRAGGAATWQASLDRASSGPRCPSYSVLRRYEISDEIWRSPDLVVERYISNSAGRGYRALVLLGRLAVLAFDTPHDVKRIPGHQRYLVEGSATPRRLRQVVARYIDHTRLDYGAIDLACDDSGVFYIIDVNLTPVWGNKPLGQVRAQLDPRRLSACGNEFLFAREGRDPGAIAEAVI